jgi:hypothetical protein
MERLDLLRKVLYARAALARLLDISDLRSAASWQKFVLPVETPDVGDDGIDFAARKTHVWHPRMRIGEKSFETFRRQFHPRDRGEARHISDSPRLLRSDEMAGSAPALSDDLASCDVGGDSAAQGRKSSRDAIAAENKFVRKTIFAPA